MGAWSETILGSDDALDIADTLREELGYAEWTPKVLVDNLQEIKQRMEAWTWEEIEDFACGTVDEHIAHQVIATEFMLFGAKLLPQLKDAAIETVTNYSDASTWENPEARQLRLDEFRMIVENYDNTPTEVPFEGLFQRIKSGKSTLNSLNVANHPLTH